jgi:hypothetical protein
MDDLSDPKIIKRQSKAARSKELERQEITRGLMSLPAGRAWVYEWLAKCHVWRTTFTGDGLSGAFNEGARNIGLQLLNDVLLACPDQYIAMIREANTNERNTRRNLATGSTSDNSADEYTEPATDDGDDTAYFDDTATGE